MKRIPFTLLLVGLLTGLTAAGLSQTVKKEGRYWVGEIRKTFQVRPGGTLIMEDIRGDIFIKTWDKNEVSVTERKEMDIFSQEEAERAMKEAESGYRSEGNTVRIGGPAFNRKWIESRFDLTLPKAFSCDIETEGGDLIITGLKGDVQVQTGGGDIELRSIDGPVEAHTGGGNIEIESATGEIEARTGGGDVSVSYSGGRVRVSTGGGDVEVRNTEDEVSVSTGGGDIEIRETKGDVTIQTGGGEVEIVDAGGNVEVQTGGGEIRLRNVNGNFRATTGGGSIQARTVMGNLYAKTGGGEIDMTDIQGSVDLQTGGGDVSVEVTLEDFSRPHPVTIQTGGGDIDLILPGKIPATVKAEIRYRKRSWEDYEITSDFSLKITTDDSDSRYRIIRAEGDINGGGDAVDLRTGGGNIRIRKLSR